MTSSKPYVLRALYEWILDNEHTPFLSVAANYPNTRVPQSYINEGEIVLNISPEAVHELNMSNETISFNARFSGKPFDLFIPVEAVLAIYDQQSGNGMAFTVDFEGAAKKDESETKPSLSIVK